MRTTFSVSLTNMFNNKIENATLLGSSDISATGDVRENVLIGNSGNNLLDGDAGNDLLNGAAGNDTLTGNGGDDTINGGSGNDLLDGANGNDLFVGGSGSDTLTGGGGVDTYSYGLGDILGGAIDTITDYELAVDQIDLSAILDVSSGLIADYFASVTIGGNSLLFVDVDGQGIGAAVQFATLATYSSTINVLVDGTTYQV